MGFPSLPPISSLPTIPDFPSFGPHNCHDHRYPPHTLDPFLLRANAPFTAHTSGCKECGHAYSVLQMHRLPCGHALCRSCLSCSAENISFLLEVNAPGIEAHLKEAYGLVATADDPFSAGLELCSPAAFEPADLLAEASCARAFAAALAGLTCCGVDMGLEAYIACLAPWAASAVWLAGQFVRTAPGNRKFCGWLDCGVFVPNQCAVFTWQGWWWRCVVCRGWSMKTGEAATEAMLCHARDDATMEGGWMR